MHRGEGKRGGRRASTLLKEAFAAAGEEFLIDLD
jgi:hypothetical protein